MPNWCSNTLRITANTDDTRAKLRRITELFSSDNNGPDDSVFQFIHPMPPELKDTSGPSDSDNWYNWRVSNWGTKWEECTPDVSESSENHLLVHFQTAWSPPIGVYAKLVELGFDVLATYAEGGMGYAGVWQNGHDHEFDLEVKPDENGEYPEDSYILEQAFALFKLESALLPPCIGG